MRAMMRVATATSMDEVMRAMELTPSFTCQKVAMLDIHLDFVTGGGWSEHAIFLSQLMAAWNT